MEKRKGQRGKMKKNQVEMCIKMIMKYLFPTVFSLSIFANTFSYYVTLGNTIDSLRKIVSWGVILLVICVSVCYWLFCLKDKKKYILVFTIPIIMLLGLIISCFKYNGDAEIIRQIILMMLYGVPAIIFAIYAVEEGRGIRLFEDFWLTGIFFLPMYLIFVLYATGGWESESWSKLGGMSYLSISYSALFLVLGMIIHWIFGEKFRGIIKHVIYGITVLVSIWVIVYGGSRGALLGLIVVTVILLGTVFIKKYNRKKSCVIVGSIYLVLVLSFCLGGNSSLSMWRLGSLISDVKGGEWKEIILAQTDSDREIKDIEVETESEEENIVAETEPEEESTEVETKPEEESVEVETEPEEESTEVETEPEEESTEVETKPEEESTVVETEPKEESTEVETKPEEESTEVETEPKEESTEVETKPEEESTVVEAEPEEESAATEADEEDSKVIDAIKGSNMARVYLYKYALKEIIDNPITGMGVYGYQMKYGTYPHNFILHVFVDFGIPVAILIFAWVLYCFVFTVKRDEKRMITAVSLFCCALGFSIMLSGGIYDSISYIWIISYFQAAALDTGILRRNGKIEAKPSS